MVEGLYWWGVASLFRCPVDPDPGNCDIALVGVPHASGNASTERDQHLGPRAVRHVSALQRRYHAAFGLSPWEACRINDLGDVPFPEANDNEACIERITTLFSRIARAGARPVAIGGDHSVTGGIVQGLVGPSPSSPTARWRSSTWTPTSTPTNRFRTGSAPGNRRRTGRATSSARGRSIPPPASRSASGGTRAHLTGSSRVTTSATRSFP